MFSLFWATLYIGAYAFNKNAYNIIHIKWLVPNMWLQIFQYHNNSMESGLCRLTLMARRGVIFLINL